MELQLRSYLLSYHWINFRGRYCFVSVLKRVILVCAFEIPWKDVFQFAFFFWKKTLISNWFCLTKNHLIVFSVSLLCFQIFAINLTLWPNNTYDLCNCCRKLDFLGHFYQKICLLFFLGFYLVMFHNNIVKISKVVNKGNLLKTCFKFTYPTNFCIFCSPFYYGENKSTEFF